MVTRGNRANAKNPDGDPGALKLFHFRDGELSNLGHITVGGRGGYGYGPRHADFHPTRPWTYISIEIQNQLHMHRLNGDGLVPEPDFIKPTTRDASQQGVLQVAGAIHVHPRGHVVYVSNRVSATTNPVGAFPFVAGENNIAVFAIDPNTGEPTPIQFTDPHGFHIRTFTVDPSGRLLIAASMAAMTVGKNDAMQTVPAGLSLFRIADDGRLAFARRYDVELAPGVQQFWTRSFALPS